MPGTLRCGHHRSRRAPVSSVQFPQLHQGGFSPRAGSLPGRRSTSPLCRAFRQRGFFHHSHSQRQLSHLPNSHPRPPPESQGSKPSTALPSWTLLPRARGASAALQAAAACEAPLVVACPCRHGTLVHLGGGSLFPRASPGAVDTLVGSTVAVPSQLPLPRQLLRLEENPFAGVISHQVP